MAEKQNYKSKAEKGINFRLIFSSSNSYQGTFTGKQYGAGKTRTKTKLQSNMTSRQLECIYKQKQGQEQIGPFKCSFF